MPTDEFLVRTLQGQPTVSASAVFGVETSLPGLASEIEKRSPGLSSVLRVLENRVVVPSRAVIDAGEAFYRLGNHNRSFCYALVEAAGDPYSSPALVFKGVEPLFPDFDKLVDWMLVAPFRKSSRVMADHFPLAEGKIPGALSLKEATREAAIAGEIQLKHWQAYGELARIPTPLAVYAFSPEDNERCKAVLKRKLAQAAFGRIEPLLLSGLGAYVYWYPSAPVRANALAGPVAPRLAAYMKTCPSETAVARWVQLLARLFLLGYLPCTPWSEGLGSCMDFGNATLDGGFCDPDSIEPIAECPDDEFFFESVVRSLSILRATIARVTSPSHGLERYDLYPDIEEFGMSRYVHYAFERALEAEVRPGLRLDDRVAEILAPRNYADLKRLLSRKDRPRNLPLFLRKLPPG